MEKVIVYVMWSYREFTKVEVIAEFTRRGLPIENVEASLETLQIYSILSRKNGKYTFTYTILPQIFGKNFNRIVKNGTEMSRDRSSLQTSRGEKFG